VRGRSPSASTFPVLRRTRVYEVGAILPVLAQAIDRITARVPAAQFVVARAPKLADDLFAPLEGTQAPVRLVEGRTDDVLNACDVVITASGTATVQAALHERPMVIVYRLSPLTYHLGRRFVSVDTFGMANLIAGRRVVPELIQDDFTPERTAEEAVAFLTD